MIDLQSLAPGFTPRPKRKYTVTERVLAANRANLALANAVPSEIRLRSTERRRQAGRRNLQLALIAKKRDRSLHYASSFRNGWYVADPERALALLGATPEEYHRHLQAWRREVGPRNKTEAKLAHAMGMLSWRWIAGVRLECDLETLKINHALQELAAARAGGAVTPGGAPDATPVTAAQLAWLACVVDDALGGWVNLDAPLERISGRMLRLWQELLNGRGGPRLDLKILRCRGHRQAVVVEHSMHSAYELAAPFESCRRTEATVCPNPREILPVEQWAGSRSGVDSQQSTIDSREAEECGERGAKASTERGSARQAFLAEARRSDLARLLEARRRGWELPGRFEDFLRTVQAAIGGPGSAGIRAASCPAGVANPPADSEGPAARRWERRVRLFARAVWKALDGLKRHAEGLLEFLSRRLGNYAASLWPEWWPRSFYWGVRSAHRMVGALGGGPMEGRGLSRGEDLADLHFEQRMRFGRDLYGRWRRCQAAIAVMTGNREWGVG